MNHKINPKFHHSINHGITSNSNQHHSDNNQASNNLKPEDVGYPLPQNSFKDFLKSKVHRPHVSPDFIEKLKNHVSKS